MKTLFSEFLAYHTKLVYFNATNVASRIPNNLLIYTVTYISLFNLIIRQIRISEKSKRLAAMYPRTLLKKPHKRLSGQSTGDTCHSRAGRISRTVAREAALHYARVGPPSYTGLTGVKHRVSFRARREREESRSLDELIILRLAASAG